LLPEIEKRLLRAGTEAPLLVKVSKAAKLLEVHVDHVYRLIHNGELVGYPFPDPDSHIHVEYASLLAMLDRRREHYRADTSRRAKIA
jgi:hypothetical protein